MTLPFRVTYGYRKNIAGRDEPPVLEYREVDKVVHARSFEEVRAIVWKRHKKNPSITCLYTPDEIDRMKQSRQKK